jgi:hypothetical protein
MTNELSKYKLLKISIVKVYHLLAVPGPVDIQTSNPDGNTLVFTWGPPANPNGVILNYSISIINIRDGSIVRQGSTVNTSFTQANLGMCGRVHVHVLKVIELIHFQFLEYPTM